MENSIPDLVQWLTVKTQAHWKYRTKLPSGYVPKVEMKQKWISCLDLSPISQGSLSMQVSQTGKPKSQTPLLKPCGFQIDSRCHHSWFFFFNPSFSSVFASMSISISETWVIIRGIIKKAMSTDKRAQWVKVSMVKCDNWVQSWGSTWWKENWAHCKEKLQTPDYLPTGRKDIRMSPESPTGEELA